MHSCICVTWFDLHIRDNSKQLLSYCDQLRNPRISNRKNSTPIQFFSDTFMIGTKNNHICDVSGLSGSNVSWPWTVMSLLERG